MRRLAVLLAVLTALWLPALAGAQSAQDDRGYLQALLEDNLSDAGRDVRIVGFAGALSARASIDELTIADADGIWLTLKGVVLDWNRSALLRGALEVTELSADEILMPRRPDTGSGGPSPEASGFSLPELPVSVDIARISAAKVTLGEAVLGAAAVVSLEGTAHLSGGAGDAALDILRTDGPRGALHFEASYANTSKELSLTLTVAEGADGIAANLIGLPGRPAIDLTVSGTGPVSDFTADIDLATDGEKRLQGQVALAANENAAEGAFHRFTANLGGDIAPAFLPAYRAFFGPDIRLDLSGRRYADGRTLLDDLTLTTDAMRLDGQLALGPEGWPEMFALTGQIAHADGAAVLLPLTGAPTRIGKADISLSYNSAAGDEWQGEVTFAGLQRDDIEVAAARLTGSGTLETGDGGAVGRVLGDVKLNVQGIGPNDPALAAAIGPDVQGSVSFDWIEDQPLAVTDLALTGTGYSLTGAATAQGLSTGLTVETTGDVVLSAPDISQFSGLAGTPLSGGAQVGLNGQAAVLGGAFQIRIEGTGTDLGIGQSRLDPLFAGPSKLSIAARRDETGTWIDQFQVTTDHARTTASGSLKTDASSGTFEVRLDDAALVEPGLTGPAALTGTVQQSGPVWAFALDATGPGSAEAEIQGNAQIDAGVIGRVTGTMTARATSLAPYAELAGQDVSGAVDLSVTGWLDARDFSFDATLAGSGKDIGIGQPMADLLLRGASRISAEAHSDTGEVIVLDALDLVTPELTAALTGAIESGTDTLKFSARLRDLVLLAPGVPGPVSADGTATLNGQTWQVATQATGPGGSTLQASGQVRADMSRADLTLSGAAPLALANRMISPNLVSGQASYDLSLSGPLALSSLSGTVRGAGGRVILPNQRLAFDIDTATAQLSGGRAVLDIAASVASGGRLSVAGPVTLSPPFNADLAIRLANVGLSDGAIYDTSVDGQATLRGSLTGGARIGADLTLGPTELRIPESGFGSAALLEDLRHRNEPADVRQTRARAGLLGNGASGGSGKAYPIDIILRAPARVFVRGRGLDAELGGQLRLTGSSANVVPRGQFDLIRGRLDILGKRLTLTEGNVRLQGSFDPFLRFVAQTRAEDTDVRIVIEGLASAPVVSFTSSPDLPEDEVLALLLFGRDITQISPLQALRLAAAVRTLAGGGGEGVVNRLRRNFGLDDLDVTTGDDGVATARVGKYITENIYTDITVGADGSSEINLNLTLSPSVTARGSVGSDGNSSLGVFFERDY